MVAESNEMFIASFEDLYKGVAWLSLAVCLDCVNELVVVGLQLPVVLVVTYDIRMTYVLMYVVL